MVRVTLWFGVIMVLFGIVSYIGTGATSLTALIPAFLGVPIALLGIAARNEQRRTMALRAAVALGILGLLGTFSGISGVMSALILDGKIIPTISLRLQAVMAIGCALFVALYVRNVMMARRTTA